MSLPRGSAGQAQGAPEIGTRQPWRTIPLTVNGGLYSDGISVQLAPIDDGQVLANTSGSSGAPVGTSLSDLLDHDLTNLQGSIIFRTAAAWTFLGPGTSGFFLKAQGPSADVVWAAVPPGVSPANPTATASDVAVNGVLTTYMRSDAAPAVQKTSASQFGLCKVDGTTITSSGGVISSTGGATGANPTATASDIAVNGVATTFMRSDAAPAVQKTSASQFGLCKPDGSSITASGGVLSAAGFAPSGTPFHPGYQSGRWYIPPFVIGVGTGGIAANTLWTVPFYVAFTTTFTKIAVNIVSAVAGKHADLLIYANSNGIPAALEYDAGQISVASTGIISLTGLTLTLAAGWHWLAFWSDAAPNIATIGTAPFVGNFIGLPTISGSGANVQATQIYATGSPPNPFPAVTYSTSVMPLIGLSL